MEEKNVLEELKNKEEYTVDDLRKIVEILRSENGCPWDRVQTHKSVRQDLLEEAYETAEAIDCESDEMLCEELGDVLLQVMFHARIAEEEGRFGIGEVCYGVCRKMIERHPHVFGEAKADTVDQVLTNWDAIKQSKKNRETLFEQLDGVCKALPALMLAAKYASKCNKNGVDLGLMKDDEALTEEFVGEELFRIAAEAKLQGIDPELALQKKCERFLANIED